MKTLIGLSVTMVVIMLPIEPAVQAHPSQERVYQNVSVPLHQVRNGPSCKFDSLTIEEQALIWGEMSPRHRDYHWRRMTPDQRQEFKKYLPNSIKQSMTHRYAPKHFYDGMSDVPTGWRKRLTHEERMILREQIVHAHKNLAASQSKKNQTPAEAENDYELQIKIRELSDKMHSECIMFSFSQTIEPLEQQKEEQAAVEQPSSRIPTPASESALEISTSSAQPANSNQAPSSAHQ